MNFIAHIENKKKTYQYQEQVQGLEHTLTAEKMYSIDFSVTKKKFCLSLHYNGANGHFIC